MENIRITRKGQSGFEKRAELEKRRQLQIQMIVDATPHLESAYDGFRDVVSLPHNKSELIQALLNQIANMDDRRTVNGLCQTIIRLAFFQRNVEGNPLANSTIDVDSVSQLDHADFLDAAAEHQRMITAQQNDLREITQWMKKALDANPHLLPIYIKYWHKFRSQGAYSPFAPDFIEIPYLSSR